MNRNNIKIVNVTSSSGFVGIKAINNSIEIHVPQVFRQEKSEKLYKDLLAFLRSIYLAKLIDVPIETSDKEGESWAIESYLWLIRDYIENGYYYNREKVYSNQQNGKIDWKRTLKNMPLYSDGNLIYTNLVTSKMAASNDIIAQIYKICLKISVERVGWVFDFNMFVDAQQIKPINEMIYLINKELNSTFDDIKKLRFKHMIKVLDNIGNDNALSNIFTYGIKNYYYVFEAMVDKLFQGIEDKKKYNPDGYWKLNNQEEYTSSNLRPDTIYKKDNQTFIIDAKMYQYGFTKQMKDLPKTSSMQKQITYGDFVHNNVDPNSDVRNAFVLPYNKELKKFKDDENISFSEDHNFAYIGEASVNYRDKGDVQDYDHIFTFFIDFNYLISNYDTNDLTYINQLVDTTNDLLDKSKGIKHAKRKDSLIQNDNQN